MRSLRLDNGAVNVAGAKLSAQALQRVRNVPQESFAPVDRERLGGGEDSVKLGVGQANGHCALNFR